MILEIWTAGSALFFSTKAYQGLGKRKKLVDFLQPEDQILNEDRMNVLHRKFTFDGKDET